MQWSAAEDEQGGAGGGGGPRGEGEELEGPGAGASRPSCPASAGGSPPQLQVQRSDLGLALV